MWEDNARITTGCRSLDLSSIVCLMTGARYVCCIIWLIWVIISKRCRRVSMVVAEGWLASIWHQDTCNYQDGVCWAVRLRGTPNVMFYVFVFILLSWGPFYWYGLTSSPAWISNHIPSEVWEEIIYPFRNVNGCDATREHIHHADPSWRYRPNGKTPSHPQPLWTFDYDQHELWQT